MCIPQHKKEYWALKQIIVQDCTGRKISRFEGKPAEWMSTFQEGSGDRPIVERLFPAYPTPTKIEQAFFKVLSILGVLPPKDCTSSHFLEKISKDLFISTEYYRVDENCSFGYYYRFGKKLSLKHMVSWEIRSWQIVPLRKKTMPKMVRFVLGVVHSII